MNGIQELVVRRFHALRSVLLVGTCVALALVGGCASILEDGSTANAPDPVSPMETIHVDAYYYNLPSLDALISKSPLIIAGHVLEWRFEIMGLAPGAPDTAVPSSEPRTVVTIEVTEVFAGQLKPGDKVEVYQMGGADEKTVWAYDQVPYLPDHRGEDLILFLSPFEYSKAKSTPYWVTGAFEGLWLNDSGHLTLLRGVAFAALDDPKYDGPLDRQVPGAPDFPTSMTMEELKQAIAKVK